MSAEEIQRLNARVLATWKGASHGGIDPEEWDEIMIRRRHEAARRDALLPINDQRSTSTGS